MEKERSHNTRTILFVIIICLVSSIVLSVLATALRTPQEIAKELDRSKQMLIASAILDYEGYFKIEETPGKSIKARWDPEKQILVPTDSIVPATQDEILFLYKTRIKPKVTDIEGNLYSFEEVGIDQQEYIEEHAKSGYSLLQYKLLYEIMPNISPDQITSETLPEGYVFPINGFGLWDAIYGYLAVANDGDTVIGGTWYEQAETAGLGAEIASPQWQEQLPGKLIFEEASTGTTNFQKAPVGLTVVKGKVSEVLASSPKAKSALDGISGASLTGKGVSEAYASCLKPYRAFLIKARARGGSE